MGVDISVTIQGSLYDKLATGAKSEGRTLQGQLVFLLEIWRSCVATDIRFGRALKPKDPVLAKPHRVWVTLPDELHDFLFHESASRGLKLSAFVRVVLWNTVPYYVAFQALPDNAGNITIMQEVAQFILRDFHREHQVIH